VTKSQIQSSSQKAGGIARTSSREDLILDAADRLLARYGYKKMTIDDVAREAGIGKGTVYLHFKSKQDLVLSHIDRIIDRLLEEFDRIVTGDASADEKLREMLLLRVLFRFDSVQHYTESIAEVLRDLRTELLERRKRYFEDEAKIIAKVVREGQKTGALRLADAPATARALVAATNSLLPYSLSTAELGRRKDVEQSTRRIVELLLNGLRAAT
jgi:AcrR family transcriptional regulator